MPNKQSPIILGPFTGGINNRADPSAISDQEVIDCVNLELDLSNALQARPPVVNLAVAVTTQRGLAIGNAVFGANSYVFFSNSAGIWALKHDGTISVVTATIESTCAIQYKDKVWFVRKPGTGSGGGSWDGTTFAAVANMPTGGAAVIYKERMWIVPGYFATANSSRLLFSTIADPTAWTVGTDFFDVTPGDGEKLIDLTVNQNNLLLFKNDSTYVLSYETKPADASMIQVSNTLGTSRQYCMATYEDYIYVYHEGLIFELINYSYSPISVQVPFSTGAQTPARSEEVCLFIFGDRLCFRIWSNLYVFGLRTRTWSRWVSENTSLNNFGVLYRMPANLIDGTPDVYYGGSTTTADINIYKIKDKHTSTDIEKLTATPFIIKCSITTKNYDFALGHIYKRLFWWGADVLSDRQVTGTVAPISFGTSTLWSELAGFTWDIIPGTWDSPKSTNAVLNTVTPGGFGVLRRFIRFLKGLRFRQINFRVDLETDGSTVDGPCKLYTVTVFVKAKEQVSKQVS